MWRAGIFLTFAVFAKSELTTTTSTTTPLDDETQETNSFSSPYMPSSAFKDIFTGNIPTIMMADEGSSSLDDNYVSTYGRYDTKMKNIEKITTQPTKTTSTNESNQTNLTSPPPETTFKPTLDFERFYITVSGRPMVQKQRGVLDMLFPKERVRSFKSVFDGLRRFLSHTFK